MMVWMMSACVFFFNKNSACPSSVLALDLITSNSIRKSAVCLLPCLNFSISHSALVWEASSAKVSSNSSANWSQLTVSSLSSISRNFMSPNCPAVPPFRRAMTAIALSSASTILLKRKKSFMLLHQSSNLLLVPSKVPGSGTKLLCPVVGATVTTVLVSSSAIDGDSDSSEVVSSSEVLSSSEVVSSSSSSGGSLYDCADAPENVLLIGSTPVLGSSVC